MWLLPSYNCKAQCSGVGRKIGSQSGRQQKKVGLSHLQGCMPGLSAVHRVCGLISLLPRGPQSSEQMHSHPSSSRDFGVFSVGVGQQP